MLKLYHLLTETLQWLEITTPRNLLKEDVEDYKY